jgi:hypothetical protein
MYLSFLLLVPPFVFVAQIASFSQLLQERLAFSAVVSGGVYLLVWRMRIPEACEKGRQMYHIRLKPLTF